jgi:hypothetical protein
LRHKDDKGYNASKGDLMLTLAKKYIVDENNKKVAVQIPFETFRKMEEAIEDYALGQYILEVKDDKSFTLAEAKKFYGKRTRS